MAEEQIFSMEPILKDEWKYLMNPPDDYRDDDHFIAKQVALDHYRNSCLKSHKLVLDSVDLITQVTRLREVKALKGFRRLQADGELVSVNPEGNEQWLPAVENFGEGIFIQFDRSRIDRWINEHSQRLNSQVDTLIRSREENELNHLRDPSPLYLILHTISHLIIRQIAFESGYAAASVSERIYATGDKQAGVLIYTAGAGSEGSLGGLVEQGLPERLVPMMLASLEKAEWCSNDPICREIPGQGMFGLNEAACHACTLLPETSCEMFNLLLNRNIIVGTERDPGYFTEALNAKRKEIT
jgi:hypothetical protein